MYFGDGTSAPIRATVNSSDAGSDIINTSAQFLHTYTSTAIANSGGLFVVNALNSGDRLATIFDGNKNNPYNLQARVNVSANAPFNNSPASSLPAIVNVPDSQISTFTIPGVDPDNDVVTFRLSKINSPTTNTNTPGTRDESRESGLTIQSPPGFSLSPSGTVVMNTTAASYVPGQLYAVQVMMEDRVGNAASAVKSKVPVDFLIRIVPFSNPPVFVSPTPANNTTFTVVAGGNVNFSVAARDNDTGNFVTLNPVQVPPGSTMSPALPVTGPVNGTVTSTFNWNTTSTDVGTKILTFAAVDNFGVQTFTSVTIQVLCALDATAVITGNPCFGQSAGAINLTAANFSAAANLRYSWTGPNGFNATSEDLTGLAAGTYTVRIDDIQTNCFIIKNFVVGQPSQVTASAAATDVSCPGRSDGLVMVNASGGTGSLSYSWTPNIADGAAAGALAPGTYSITVVDANGCAAATSAIVGTTPDQSSPVPDVAALPQLSGACSVTITAAPTATDNCSGLIVGTTADALSYTAQGTYTVNWIYNDGNGNTSTQQQLIVVRDLTAPATPALAAITAACAATVTVPTTTDNCAGTVSGTTSDPLSYDTQGTYTIHWTFSDGNGNSTTADQTVTIADHIPPSITAPANFTVGTDPGQCSASGVALGAATTSDNCGVASVTNNAPAVFPKGMTIVTWTVTDVNGNSATATQAVTVVDNENPIIAAPVAVNATADAGQCYATIPDLGFPSFQDNCPGSTYTSTANANARYNVGITVVGYTVTDAAGHQATAFQSVVVTDNQNPGITAPANVTVPTNPGQCEATGVVLGTPTTADNCGVAQVFNNAPSTFPKGTTTVIWTVRDVNGNTATASQAVTVEDRQNPTITAPAAITTVTSADGSGNCTTKAMLGAAVAADNCGGTSITARVGNTIINPGTYNFPTGVTIVTWTATDGSGNSASADQAVTVIDDEKPVIACSPNVQQCYNAGGNMVSASVTASDNCSSALTTTYAITGATTGSGTGSSINRSFNTGTSTITWTVRDAANNASTCSVTVTVRPLPAVSIATSTADEFCNAITLTAGIAPAGTASYAWTYNNAPFATTQSVKLNVSNGDGTYRVTATDAFGCSSAPASYVFQKQTLVSMYVLLGMKDVDLAQNNEVINGSVGVTSSYGEANFDKYCSVASTGAFVKAADINVKNPVTIPTKIYSQAIVTLPTMYLNSSNPGSLNNYVMTTNGTVTGNKKDLTINSGKTVTVTGNIFRKIRICQNADVTFSASDISLEALDIDKGATVRFSGNTKLRVTDEVSIDKECSVNPGAKIVTFYIKDPASGTNNCFGNWSLWHSWLGGASEKFVVHGKGTNVIANVYVPNGKIRVHGNGWDCNWNQSESCNMMGLFIAEEIEGDGKNINWYSYDCGTPASFRQAGRVAQVEEAADYKVLMYPNPTTGQFTLQFGNTTEAAEVRISDIQGRLISTRSVGVNEMPSATFNLNNQVPGVYMVEIHQGASTVRNRMVLR